MLLPSLPWDLRSLPSPCRSVAASFTSFFARGREGERVRAKFRYFKPHRRRRRRRRRGRRPPRVGVLRSLWGGGKRKVFSLSPVVQYKFCLYAPSLPCFFSRAIGVTQTSFLFACLACFLPFLLPISLRLQMWNGFSLLLFLSWPARMHIYTRIYTHMQRKSRTF